MLPQSKVDEVRYYLSLGTYSQRAISRITGVSRAVVHRIATGKRKDGPRAKDPWEVEWKGNAERCPVCGAHVKLPCMACIIRNVAQPRIFSDGENYLTGLELKEEHRVRYEQVKEWREDQADPTFTEVPKDWPFRKCFKKKASV